MCKTPKVELYSDYYSSVDNFIKKTLEFVKNPSDSFEDERATLLKDANFQINKSYSSVNQPHTKEPPVPTNCTGGLFCFDFQLILQHN